MRTEGSREQDKEAALSAPHRESGECREAGGHNNPSAARQSPTGRRAKARPIGAVSAANWREIKTNSIKLIPPPHARTHTRCMFPEPATAISRSAPDPRRVIGLFLARLFAYLLHLQASGQTVIPKKVSYMVGSAEVMVNGFIRTLAVKQLNVAGHTYAARAMRDPDILRKARRPAQAVGGADTSPASADDLLTTLTTTIENFERADILASVIARMIVCALSCVVHETRERTVHTCRGAHPGNAPCRVTSGPPAIIPVAQGPPCFWPPPILAPWSPPGKAAEITHQHINSFPGLREQDRDPETRLTLLRFRATALSTTHRESGECREAGGQNKEGIHKRPRRRNTTETKSKKRCQHNQTTNAPEIPLRRYTRIRR